MAKGGDEKSALIKGLEALAAEANNFTSKMSSGGCVKISIDKVLLIKAVDRLKDFNDDGPAGRGWQSDGLLQLIDDLEDVLGIAHENRWKGFFK